MHAPVICGQVCGRHALHPYNPEVTALHVTACAEAVEKRTRDAELECGVCLER